MELIVIGLLAWGPIALGVGVLIGKSVKLADDRSSF